MSNPLPLTPKVYERLYAQVGELLALTPDDGPDVAERSLDLLGRTTADLDRLAKALDGVRTRLREVVDRVGGVPEELRPERKRGSGDDPMGWGEEGRRDGRTARIQQLLALVVDDDFLLLRLPTLSPEAFWRELADDPHGPRRGELLDGMTLDQIPALQRILDRAKRKRLQDWLDEHLVEGEVLPLVGGPDETRTMLFQGEQTFGDAWTARAREHNYKVLASRVEAAVRPVFEALRRDLAAAPKQPWDFFSTGPYSRWGRLLPDLERLLRELRPDEPAIRAAFGGAEATEAKRLLDRLKVVRKKLKAELEELSTAERARIAVLRDEEELQEELARKKKKKR